MAGRPNEVEMYKWLPVVSEERCTGCTLCIEACESECLEMDSRLAVFTDSGSDACDSDGECVRVCADDAMEMRWVELDADSNVGRWCEAPESASASAPTA